MKQTDIRHFFSSHKSFSGFILIILVYAFLLLPTLNRQGVSWDEQTDILVARAYLKGPDGWLTGSNIDASQTRLPAFTVALVYSLFAQSSLIIARWVSALVGALTLAGVYVYCRQRLDTRRGLLACALLATSPFYLSFARVAFTETDIYLACALAWLLVCVDRMQEKPSIRNAVWVGLITGLSISAKFTAIAVIPAIWYSVWQSKKHENKSELIPEQKWIIIYWIILILVCLFVGLFIPHYLSSSTYQGTIRFFHYSLLLVGFLLTFMWGLSRKQYTTPRFMLIIFITGLAIFTFLVVPPEHVTNPEILNSLASRFQHEMTYRLSFMAEAAALHILSILFKSSLIIGAGLLISLVLAVFRYWNWKKIFPLLVVLFYFGCLVFLPLAQTFYTIPILPILAIFTADRFIDLFPKRRIAAFSLAFAAVLMLGIDLLLCYPDYNLNGYQWLGKRILAGRPSIGYRSVVQTSSDGVEQAMEWLNQNARAGEVVRTYIFETHIMQEVAPNPVYKIERSDERGQTTSPDYVVTEINSDIRQSWWIRSAPQDIFKPLYSPSWLETNYTKVFTVRRAFNIEVATVYQKK